MALQIRYNVVPQTSASTEEVLMVLLHLTTWIVAARGEKIFTATAGGSWTERDSGRTSAGTYTFERFNFDGNNKLIVVDGATHLQYLIQRCQQQM